MVQWVYLVGHKIQLVDGYVAVCLVLTIDVYDWEYLGLRIAVGRFWAILVKQFKNHVGLSLILCLRMIVPE